MCDNSSIEKRKIELDEYSKSVKLLAKQKSDLIFKNKDKYHATVVLSEIFRHSENTVCIYDKDLSGDLSDLSFDFRKSLIGFVNSETKKLNIVIKDKLDYNSRLSDLLFKLKRKYPSNIDIKLANPSFRQNVNTIFDRDINFAIGDDNKFRIEETENKDNRKAFCSFNNTQYTSVLSSIYNKEFNNCDSLVEYDK